MSTAIHDYFISYKHDDSSELAASLQKALTSRQLSVWLDQEQIAPGDSILETIELGLSSSIDALVLISPNYFSGWAQRERAALFAKMASGRFRIVPILYGVTTTELAARSPMFADLSVLVAKDASDATAEFLAQRLVDTTKPDRKELRLFEIFFRCVLEHRGYDADIALFLGVLDDNVDAVKEALERGGNALVTPFDMFKRYWRDAISFGCWEEWRKLVIFLNSTGKLKFSFPDNSDGTA